MKNLLGKIGKLALVPALALSLGVQKSNAQKIEFNPGIYVGGTASNYRDFKIYDNWENHFKGLDGGEKLKYKKINGSIDFLLGTDLGVLFKNNFSFGLSLRYSLSENSKEEKKYLSQIELHNWEFDYAGVHEIFLKQKTPSLGVYLKFPVAENMRLALRSSLRKGEVHEIKREDKNLSSRLKCSPTPSDETESLTEIFDKSKSGILLNKSGLEFQFYNEGLITGIELFYETDWNNVRELGATINLSVDNLY